MTEHRFPRITGAASATGRRLRMRSRRGEGGQTMPLVLGIILVLSLGTVVLVQNTFQQFPIVSKDMVQHEAYRAMVSGLDEYQYAVNANADFAACSARFFTPPSTYANSALTSSSTVCSALSFGTWISVPGSGAANGPPGWFLVDNPVINTSTGNLSVNIVGAAGYKNEYNYQTAVVTLQPLNGFLLNVVWINYDQIDPAVVSQYGGGTCQTVPTTGGSYEYYWQPNPNALQPNCESLDFISSDTADRQPVRERHGLRVREPLVPERGDGRSQRELVRGRERLLGHSQGGRHPHHGSRERALLYRVSGVRFRPGPGHGGHAHDRARDRRPRPSPSHLRGRRRAPPRSP